MVVLAGTVSADPVQRRMPSGDEVTELRLSVPEAGRRLLPLPVAAQEAGFAHPITSPFALVTDLRLPRSAHRLARSGWQPRGQGFESPWVHFRRSEALMEPLTRRTSCAYIPAGRRGEGAWPIRTRN